MRAALAYEWVRISTIRSSYWITGVAVLIGVGISFLISMGTSFEFDDQPADAGEIEFLAPAIITQFAAVAGPYLVAYILVIIGVLAWGHEYRHGMVRVTLTAHGSRGRIWLAKYAVLGLWVVAAALAIMLLSTLVGLLWLNDDGVQFGGAPLLEQMARTAAYALLFVWSGAAITSILRNQTAALVAVFVWPLAVEPLLGLVIRLIPGLDSLEDLTKFFPYNAGDRLLRNTEAAAALDELLGGDQLSTLGGFAVFGAFCGLLMLASYLLFQKRDA